MGSTTFRPARESRPAHIEGLLCSFYYQQDWHPSPDYIRHLGQEQREARGHYAHDPDEAIALYDGPSELPKEIIRLSLADIEILCQSCRNFQGVEEFLSYKDHHGIEASSPQLRRHRADMIDEAADSLHWILAEDAKGARGFTFAECCDMSEGADPARMRQTFLTVITAWLKRSPVAVLAIRGTLDS